MGKEKLKVLSLCDGISCGLMAFNRLGVDVDYYAVEIDPHARKISNHNFKNIYRFENDVTKITKEDMEEFGPFDWIMFGSPCQSVSVAGNGEGLNGKSGLLIDCVKILKWCQELNPEIKYLVENVKMKKEFLLQFDSILGNQRILINSYLVSAQKRERYYWTNFKVELPKDKNISMEGVLAWSRSTRYPQGKDKYVEERTTENGKANTLTCGSGCGSFSSINYRYSMGNKLTVRDCADLQTIPTSFDFSCTSNSQAYKAIGNGWTVDVIAHIIKQASIYDL